MGGEPAAPEDSQTRLKAELQTGAPKRIDDRLRRARQQVAGPPSGCAEPLRFEVIEKVSYTVAMAADQFDKQARGMKVVLPLNRMTTAEKLLEMERLWDDLCRNVEGVPSPAWHEAVLVEREKMVSRGKMGFSDLDDAKKRIRTRSRSIDAKPPK